MMNDPCDQTQFLLDDEQWEEFVRRIDEPARENAGLRRLLAMRAPWEGQGREPAGRTVRLCFRENGYIIRSERLRDDPAGQLSLEHWIGYMQKTRPEVKYWFEMGEE